MATLKCHSDIDFSGSKSSCYCVDLSTLMCGAMNKLELMRTFVRVTELQSFTQAAASLGLPKTSVSEHVRDLEELLGARLLNRTTRKVSATQDGLALYQRCKDMLADMDEVESMFRLDGRVLAGRLRVDMPTIAARLLVMPHLGEFLRAYPHIEIEVSSTDRRVDLVREGFDCVVRAGDVRDPSLIARYLGAVPIVNCASPAYLQQFGTPQTLADLARHRLVHYVALLGGRSAGFEYLQDGQLRQLPMNGPVTVNNTEAFQGACLGGLGIAQAPLSGVRAHLEAGRLVALLPQFLPPPMPIALLYTHRRHLPQRTRVFLDWLSGLIEREWTALPGAARPT